MTTWRRELQEAFEETGDVWVACTLSDEELDTSFDPGYGSEEGKPFTCWGEKYVYFPVCYDGSEWVGWSPRFPSDEATGHHGGG